MSSLPVFATTFSKLHADIAIIRLIRGGIRTEKISSVFPRGRAPNSVCCWLKHFNRIPFVSSLPIAAAGALGLAFKDGVSSPKAIQDLEDLGLDAELTGRLLERTDAGRIVICVHARTEAEAAIAWDTFRHIGAEDITGPNRKEEAAASASFAQIAA